MSLLSLNLSDLPLLLTPDKGILRHIPIFFSILLIENRLPDTSVRCLFQY